MRPYKDSLLFGLLLSPSFYMFYDQRNDGSVHIPIFPRNETAFSPCDPLFRAFTVCSGFFFLFDLPCFQSG